jgi:glycosyltransferase involved in cell wall biosynthesis
MKNGIFYLTYNGYYNFTTGIGTQTKIFLKGIETHYNKLKKIYGDFEINLIVPRFDNTVNGFEEKNIYYANKIIDKIGGKVYKCNSSLDKQGCNFWSVSNWRRISTSAASIILENARRYNKILVMAVDPPFLHVPRYIEEYNDTVISEIQSVILMYTSSYIHDKEKLSYEKLGWEYSGFSSARNYKKIKIGKVSNFLFRHFIEYYGADPNSFIQYPSSLVLEDDDFKKKSTNKIINILKKYDIPTEKDIVFAFGRAAWIKGFDIFLESIRLLKKNIHIVLIAVPFENIINEYKKKINKLNLKCSLIPQFTRELPIALCQHKYCRIVVCPSRGEPFSNIPLEVSIWARDQGPIILTSNVDGYVEQIDDGINGFIYNNLSCDDLAKKIEFILQLSEDQLFSIRSSAYCRVVKERNFFDNFKMLMDSCW